MTNSDIIKAEYNKIIEGLDYTIYPFVNETDVSIAEIKTFIRYQQDEIERLKAEYAELEAEIDKQYEQARADILGNMADGGASCHWCIDGHRKNAIKDFAERLKEKAYTAEHEWSQWAPNEHPLVVEVDDIDELVAEMEKENELR